MKEILHFLSTWGSVLGLIVDIFGAALVFRGVKISIEKANALEEVALATGIDGVGSQEILMRNKALSKNRASERVRASEWARWGLGCFLFGFILQGIASWPKCSSSSQEIGAKICLPLPTSDYPSATPSLQK